MDMDPPRHDVVRRVIAPRLQRARARELEALVRALAERLVAAFEPDSPIDLIREFARRLPALTICRLLGVRAADSPVAAELAIQLVARGSEASGREGALVAREGLVNVFLASVEERRRGVGTDDLIGDLARAVDAGSISAADVPGLCLMIVVAALEPTGSLLGTILHAIATRRAHVADVLAPDGRVAVESVGEFLRYESPVQWLSRVTTRPVRLHARLIPRGQRVLLLVASANRDPRRFRRPDVLDLRRRHIGDVAFGAGIHACLGAGLARLESRIALEVLLSRYPRMCLAGPVLRSPSHVVRGYERLPVSLVGI
jgi:cytochrome P450